MKQAGSELPKKACCWLCPPAIPYSCWAPNPNSCTQRGRTGVGCSYPRSDGPPRPLPLQENLEVRGVVPTPSVHCLAQHLSPPLARQAGGQALPSNLCQSPGLCLHWPSNGQWWDCGMPGKISWPRAYVMALLLTSDGGS